MSWQLGALAVLATALAGGFWWYERRRPDSRVLALAATLAAFAALGRIAFAALPNVKPTTDIVLISGYALGGGPGFAVGAVAGLTSNFFFGQGPWTPWQMAAWGVTGVLGACLAHVWRPPAAGPPRWPLALVCGAAGFVFTAFQDFGDWVTYSDHSLAQLAVYVGRGLGFDAVHAAACVGFALVFGPALARSLHRFARRLEVRWVPPAEAAPLVLVAALAAGALWSAAARPPRALASSTPAGYLLSAENHDGGFGAAPGQPSSSLFTGWAALGLASGGYDLRRLESGRLLTYLSAQAGSLGDPGSLERQILVVRAAGLRPAAFAGHDLVAQLERRIGRTGAVSAQVNLTAFAVLALRAAGAAVPPRTLRWLERQQDSDGGFSFSGSGGSSDVDDTGAALEALAGAGGRAAVVRRAAVRYLRRAQNRDGGFPQQPGQGSNAQSTAWAVQGLIAAGVAPGSVRRPGGRSPLGYLRSLIAPDGHVRYARASNQTPVWVTGEALMALEGKPLPLAPPPSALVPLKPRPRHRARSTGHAHGASGGSPASAAAAPHHARKHRAGRMRPRPPGHRGQPPWEAATAAELGRLSGALGMVAGLALAPLGV